MKHTSKNSKSTKLFTKLLTRERVLGEKEPEVFKEIPELTVERYLQASIARGARKSSSRARN